MSLNCKPGDLAVVVRSRNVDNIGRVVRVIKAVEPGLCIGPDSKGLLCRLDPNYAWWEIDTQLKLITSNTGEPRGSAPYAPDTFLRPLRDNDEPDETIRWAGIPQGNVRSTLDALHRALTANLLR